jgi:hypothetical protein
MRDEADDPEYLKRRARRIMREVEQGLQSVTIDGALENLRFRDQTKPYPVFTGDDLPDPVIKENMLNSGLMKVAQKAE